MTSQRVSNVGKRSADEQKFLGQLVPVRKQMDLLMSFRKNEIKRPEQILARKVSAPRMVKSNAEVKESKYLVILVNFKDKAMNFKNEDFTNGLTSRATLLTEVPEA